MRIDLTVTADEGPTLAVDGERVSARAALRWLHGIGRPYPLVWLGSERMYDVELWLGDDLVGYVPGRAHEVDAAYDDAERMIA